MTENGYGHIGRIPNYGRTQVNPMGNVEPPACIQNAMMTKDKKPFTYTPGGLDLSQIRTPSMARRLAKQRSLEEQEKAYAPHQQQFNNGGSYPQNIPAPPPPPPSKIPAPPPPPPLIIEAPNAKSVKPVPIGERPEIVIPENPIGMLRKTNSPYHWEAEKAETLRMGPVPKFVDKVPSPLTVKMPQQQMQQNYSPPEQAQQRRNYPYNNQNNQTPDSPIYKPEAQYGHHTPNSANISGSPQTRDMLLRQDSQFNKSPQPFAGQSPFSNGTPYSPTPNNNWRQPERRDSPVNKSSPLTPQSNRGPFLPVTQQGSPNYPNQSPPVFHTLPRTGLRNQEPINNSIPQQPTQQNLNEDQNSNAPWRTNTLNRYPRSENQQNGNNNQNLHQQQAYSPPWKSNDANNNRSENAYVPPWKQDRAPTQPYNSPSVNHEPNNRMSDNSATPWRNQDSSQNRTAPISTQEQPRYQSTICIPVHGNQQKPNPQPEYSSPAQKEAVYVNQEPVYYCPDSPKSIPPWVKTQKEKTKTPPPVWCNRPLEGRRSIPRDLVTPPRDTNQEPEWIKKSSELQRGGREVVSPPKYQQTTQPNWSTRPSENRKSLPKDTAASPQGTRIIPIQMEVSTTENRGRGRPDGQPQLRIVIDMKQNADAQSRAQAPYSQPTQRIMRVLSPQLVRVDDDQSQHELPTLNRNFSQDSHPKTRIIPIQVEGGNGGANKRVHYHKFIQEGPTRQSRSFRVLQEITNT